MDSLVFGLTGLGLCSYVFNQLTCSIFDSGVRMLWGRTSLWSVQIRRNTIERWSGTTLNWEKLCFPLSTGKSLSSIDHCLCRPHQHRGNATLLTHPNTSPSSVYTHLWHFAVLSEIDDRIIRRRRRITCSINNRTGHRSLVACKLNPSD